MYKKQCTMCYKFKYLYKFPKNGSKLGGIHNECKVCHSLRIKEYRRTKLGLLGSIYSSQKRRSIKRKHTPPNYSLKEFRDWALASNVFHDLYAEWVSSDYEKMLSPSADRLDDYKPYTFDNLQWMAWQENNEKHNSDRKTGINNKHSKAVKQYSLSGEFIKEFHSGREAERQTGTSQRGIGKCCLGKRKTAGGCYWRF